MHTQAMEPCEGLTQFWLAGTTVDIHIISTVWVLFLWQKGFLLAISLPVKPCLAASLANMCEIALLIMAANVRNMVLIKF